MKLYHGSAEQLSKMERRQANTGNHLPEQETRNAIYLTDSLGFALLAGGRPRGEGGGVYHPEGEPDNVLAFRDPTKFDPEKTVYVYEWNLEDLPEGSYEKYDHQYIVDLDELEVDEMTEHTASEGFEYYEFSNWPPPPTEHASEFMVT